MSSAPPEQPDLASTGMPRNLVGLGAVAMLVALLVSAAGEFFSPTAFWGGYLTAVTFWLGVSLGCLGTALLHSLTGGRWGESIGRELRAALGPFAVGLLAVIPLAFGAAMIYPGAAGSQDASVLNAHQQWYFSPPLLAGRFLLYAVVWCGLSAWLLWAHGRFRERYATAVSPRKAALGLLAFWLTVTFASVDGLMSLTPHWASSMFPLMRVVGAGVAGLAFVVLVRSLSLVVEGQGSRGQGQRTGTSSEEIDDAPPGRDSGSSPLDPQTSQTQNDLGNMLQAYNMMWTYLAFSQYIITWSGDIAEEVKWYYDRRNPVTAAAEIGLFLFHFAVPFVLLLSRDVKRNPRRLASIAGLLLFMRLVADGWIILPPTGADAAWAIALTLSNAVVLGGLWLLVFAWLRKRLPIIPEADAASVRSDRLQSVDDPTNRPAEAGHYKREGTS